jgi:hypothetical protein
MSIRCAGPRPRADIRGDVSCACCSIEELSAPFRRREVCVHASLRTKEICPSLGRPQARSSSGGLRDVPVLLRRPEDSAGRLHQDPNGGPHGNQLMHHYGVARDSSLNRFVEITSTTPARIFGMYPKKGGNCPGERRRPGGGKDPTRCTPSARRRITCAWTADVQGYAVKGNVHHRAFARRDRRWQSVPAGQPRQLSARGARRRLEVA